ncbi:MAG: histidine kinase N-terminal 7TM domain-containing protein [Anaerolineae bacterium]
MRWQYNPYALPLVAAAAVAVVLAFYVWRRRPAPGTVPFTLLMLAVAEWSLGYALELGSTDLPGKILWAKVQYPGIVFVPLTWLVFALQYTGREKWLTRRNLALLSIVPVITLLLAWTNDAHGLIWSSIKLDNSGSFPMLDLTYGVWWWVNFACSYVLLLLSTFLLVRALIHSLHLYRGQATALLIGTLAPWVGNVLYVSGLSPISHLDLTPFAFTFTGLAVAWGLSRFQLLGIVPVARDAVVESMGDAVIVLDMQNRIADLNPAAQRLTGRPASETLGQPATQVLSDWPDLVEHYRGVTEARTEIVLSEGEAVQYFDLHISPLYDQRGRLTGRLVVLRDITERKSEEEVRSKYEFIANTSMEFMTLIDRNHVYEAANESYSKAHNRTREEILGKKVADVWGEDVYETNVKQCLDKCFDGQVVHYTGWFDFSTLGQRCMDVTYYPYFSGAGDVTHAVVVSRDTTERQRAEDALERRNRELTTLYEAVTAVSSSFSLAAVLQTVAEQMTKALSLGGCTLSLWDREQSQIVTMVDHSVAWPDEAEPVCTTHDLSDCPVMRRVLEAQQPVVIRSDDQVVDEADLVWMKKGALALLVLPLIARDQVLGLVALSTEAQGYTPEEIRLAQSLATQAAIAVENARLYEQAQQEITERKRAEESLCKRTTQLESANKELEAFAYSVSHDLRAPLRSVDGFSQILLEDYSNKLDADGQNYLHRVRAASQRMAHLIEDILTLSRITRREMRREVVNLSALVQEIATELEQREPERQVEFIIEEGEVADGDAHLLWVVLENLLGNAWKYTCKHPSARIEFGVTRHDGQVAYFVRDDGAGFNTAHADKLFGAFQRLHSETEFEGTGIGLATVQRIIHRHGGRIWAEGAVEQGATFYFTLL